jgi:hypothetical protein
MENEEKVLLIPDREYRDNNHSSNSYPKIFFVVRAIIISSCIVFVYLNSTYATLLQDGEVKCLDDKIFDFTSDINKFFQKNTFYRRALLITSSFFIDFVIIFFSILWTKRGRSYRPVIAYMFFYSIRGITQNMFQMRYPEGYLWEYPGFPSLVISYLKTNDFFFSGHIGFPIIAGMEFYYFGYVNMYYFCLMSSVFEALTMIFLRGHYSIDLFAGVIFAHYAFLISEKYSYLLDDSFISMKNHLKYETIEQKQSLNIA